MYFDSTTNESSFDPYRILGVSRDSSLKDIKRRYYKLLKKYHPDRNGGDDRKITLVTKAYNILSDSNNRALYDENYKAEHEELHTGFDDYLAYQRKQPRSEYVKETFTDNDASAFNRMFEQKRARDPNDIGYGDMMEKRLEESDLVGTSRRENIPAPDRLFAKESFDPKTFNRLFEQMNEHSTGKALIEREDIGDPEGYSLLGGCGSSNGYSEISLYNGAMIVGKETDDYTATGQFTDYKRGYKLSSNPQKYDPTALDKIRNQQDPFEDRRLTKEEMKRLYAERMREYSSHELNIPKDQRKTRFMELEGEMLEQQRQERMREAEQQKQVVFKYKDQYPQELLMDLGIRDNQNTSELEREVDRDRDYRQQRTFEDLMAERNMRF